MSQDDSFYKASTGRLILRHHSSRPWLLLHNSCGTDGHTWQSCSAYMPHMLSAKSTFQQKPCLVVRTVHTYVTTIIMIIIIVTVHTWHAEDLVLRNEWCIVLEQYLEQLLCIHVWLHLTLPKSLLHWNDVSYHYRWRRANQPTVVQLSVPC